VEDKLQSRCSRIGPRNTLWRPTKMSSPTAQGPARESKESKPHRASPPGSRRLVARQAEATQIQAEPRRGGRRTAGNWAGRPRRAAAATGHSGERQATRRPVAQRPAPSGRGATGTAPRPHGARARARHAAPGARTARRGTRRSVSGSRQGRRQSPRGRAASSPAPRRPAAGAAPPRQVTGRYDLVSILNFFDSVDL